MKMNADTILESFYRHDVDAILIGGMNFLLRHQPVLTFDIDFWVNDTDENLSRVVTALRALGAEWGKSEATWGPLPGGHDWLRTQNVFCLTTPHGAVDIFRSVEGLDGQYEACKTRSSVERLESGIHYRSLSDQDMLACQLALPENLRRLDRTNYLRNLLDLR
jgi:hypothetical protein